MRPDIEKKLDDNTKKLEELKQQVITLITGKNNELNLLREQMHIANADKKTLREQLDLAKADAAALRRDFPPAPPLPTVDCTCRTCEFLRERQDRERSVTNVTAERGKDVDPL